MQRKGVRFYAESSIRDLPQAAEILRKHADLEWIEDYQTFRRETIVLEKRSVIFARKRGAWLKPFACYHQNHEYEYFSLNLAEGCLFDCVYCYLQSYLNHQALVLFLEEPALFHELEHRKRSWISTGLLSDSFLAESYYSLLPALSHHIPDDCLLELRSKSCNLPFLSDPTIRRERVVLSWSLNPQRIVDRYEYQTASLQQRLQAAKSAIDAGFNVGFHLDPVFHFHGWETAYESLFQQLAAFPQAGVAFLSLGLFRYMPDLGAVIRKRFPVHDVMTGEFFPDVDGKYHYFRGIRKQMYRQFAEWLKPWLERTPVFWSMEPDGNLL